MRIIKEIWISHPAPQELFIQKYQPILSPMNLFKMKKKQNLPHSQLEIEESLLGLTPSPAALEIYEILDISFSHMADPEEDIQIFFIEEKLSFHSMQTFSSNSFLNY